MLNALDAATTATAWSAVPSRDRYGTCSAPGSTSGPWISSETTRAPCLVTTSRIALELGPAVHVAARVVRLGEQQRPRTAREQPVERVEVDDVAVAVRVHGQVPLLASGDLAEPVLRVVRRQRQHHRRPLAEHLQRDPNADGHVRGRQHPVRRDAGPEVAQREPGVRLADRAAGPHVRWVADLAALHRLVQRSHDRLRQRVVHLGHPRRKHSRLDHPPLEHQGGAGLVVGVVADQAHPPIQPGLAGRGRMAAWTRAGARRSPRLGTA